MTALTIRENPEDVPLLDPNSQSAARNPQESSRTPRPLHNDSLPRLDTRDSWVPIALNRRTLTAFSSTFVVIIIALAVLYNYSNTHNGLGNSNQKLHYFWTFGPTAGIFTIRYMHSDSKNSSIHYIGCTMGESRVPHETASTMASPSVRAGFD